MDSSKEYSVNGLLKDEFFIRWVLNPDDNSNHYWTGIINTRHELRENISKAREILTFINYKDTHRLQDDEYSEMLDVLIRENRRYKYNGSSSGRKIFFLSIAASIALVAIISFSFLYPASFTQSESDIAEIKIEHKKARKGEKLTIRLSDGTSVKLNANSRLSYKSYFSEGKREVYLEGEAYFDVKKDPKRPFIIHTGEISTTVLGTEFNIRSYDDEKNIEVAVVEGKVKVSSSKADFVLLTSNEVSTFQKENKMLNKSKQDVNKLVAWSKNVLVFENASSEEVWKRLEDWYGVNIIIRNNNKAVGRYSGEYVNEPLETVLRGISFASGFDFEIDEKKNVVIK